MATTWLNDYIGIHVFGSGYGESVVVEFEDGSIGVIDPYSPYAKHGDLPEKHPLVNFVEKRKINKIRFVMITHPHEDHCCGAYTFLSAFQSKITSLWLYEGFFQEKFLDKLAKICRSMTNGTNSSLGRVLLELAKITQWLRDNQIETKFLHNNYKDLKVNINKKDALFKFRAPEQKILIDLDIYADKILSKINELPCDHSDPKEFDKIISQYKALLNDLSVAMSISWGATNLLLTGDSSKQCDKDDDKVCNRFAIGEHFNLIKIPHHGSSNACDCYFTRIAPPKPIGVLTPWNGGSKLPKHSRISEIKDLFSIIVTTSREGCQEPEKWINTVSEEDFKKIIASRKDTATSDKKQKIESINLSENKFKFGMQRRNNVEIFEQPNKARFIKFHNGPVHNQVTFYFDRKGEVKQHQLGIGTGSDRSLSVLNIK